MAPPARSRSPTRASTSSRSTFPATAAPTSPTSTTTWSGSTRASPASSPASATSAPSWSATTGAVCSSGRSRGGTPSSPPGVIGVNTPDLPRTPIPMVEMLRNVFPDDPPYIVQFQEPGRRRMGPLVGSRSARLPRADAARPGDGEHGRVPRRGDRGVRRRAQPARRVHAAARLLPQPRPLLAPHRGPRRSHDRRALPHDQRRRTTPCSPPR